MFIHFAKNKLSYEKGQLAPFFILILVVLIIMAMVTVNLSKVASIKTEASNAADAASLAAGSTMAQVFNVVAQANSELEFYYTDFIVATMLLYTIAFIYLGMSMASACPAPCVAAANLAIAINAIWGLLIAVTGYWVATEYFYCKIRKMTKKGRESAIAIGHQFAFVNSGIGQKLDRKQRNAFSNFLQDLQGAQEEHTYSWQDGQGRQHSVKSRVRIDEVKDYRLHTTLLPYPAELALLVTSLIKANAVEVILGIECAASWYPPNYIAWQEACVGAAIVPLAWSIGLLAGSATGLMPAPSVSSSSCGDALPWIIAWIDDIKHNRLVKVDTWQKHEGADLGLWQTRYPDTHSLSWVDFRGNGSIHPPELRHDATMIKTDQSGAQD